MPKSIDKKEQETENWKNFIFIHDQRFVFISNYPKLIYKTFLELNKQISSSRSTLSGRYLTIRAIYFSRLKFFDEAFSSLAWAKSYGAPKEIVKEIHEKCENFKKKSSKESAKFDIWNFFKLSYEPNAKLPCLVSCLKLEENEEFGKHIITTRDLKAGDIVGVTEPFFKQLNPEFCTERCSYCLKSNFLNLIDCQNCKSAMFCSETCKDAALTEYHELECIGSSKFAKKIPLHLPIKMLLTSIHDKSLHRLKTMLEKNPDATVFDFDLSDSSDLNYNSNLLLACLNLKNNIADESIELNFSALKDIVADHPKFQKVWQKDQNFVESLFKKLVKISLLKEIFSQFESTANIKFIGTGIDPYSALMNSSCCPNIHLMSVENKFVWVVTRRIKAGEQLFKSYGQNFLTNSVVDRRINLSKTFGFFCKCDACLNPQNYPLCSELKKVDEEFVYEDNFDFLLLDKYSAEEKFQKYCDYINDNSQNFPSKELCYSISMIKLKLEALSKPAMFYP